MKVKTLGALICVVASAATSCVADNDVRWVSPTGDDTKDGLTEATAWKTPQKAVDFFGTGAGTVRLTAGTFEGTNPILNLANGAVKVIGAGRDLTVLKPDNSVAKSAVSVVKSGAVVSNLTVTGCSGAYAVSLQNGGGIAFCNVVSNNAGGVKFVPAATSSFCRNCSVSFNSNASGPSAVYHNSWGAAYLRNCLFIGNTTTKASCGTVNADNGGALKVTHTEAVNGARIVLAARTQIVVGSDLGEKGIDSVKTALPFSTTAEDGLVRFGLDVGDLAAETAPSKLSVPLCTVSAVAAEALRDKIVVAKPIKEYGVTVTDAANADGTVTFTATCSRTSLLLLFK